MTTGISSTLRGLYFEQFEVGLQILTPGRTITETDIVNFAGLSGDYNQIHTDAAYSATTPFGKRVAHGLLVLSIVSGLAVRTGIMDETVIAFREVKAWKFALPVFIGDTLYALLEVVDKKSLPRLGAGSVEINIKVINQDDAVVMKGAWVVLVSLQPI